MDNIIRVEETKSSKEVERLLKDGWVLLGTANGTYEDGGAYFLYSVGLPEPPKTVEELFGKL